MPLYYVIILRQRFAVFEKHLFEPIKTRKEICLTITNTETTELSPRSLKQQLDICVCHMVTRVRCAHDIQVSRLILSSNTEKGKAIPLQAWTGPEDSRRLRIPDFKTVGI